MEGGATRRHCTLISLYYKKFYSSRMIRQSYIHYYIEILYLVDQNLI